MSRQYTHVQGLMPSVIAMKEKGYKQGGHHYENLLNQQFVQNQVNYRWVTDITYIITPLRTYYLCVVMDLCGRYIVVYRLGTLRLKFGAKPRNVV